MTIYGVADDRGLLSLRLCWLIGDRLWGLGALSRHSSYFDLSAYPKLLMDRPDSIGDCLWGILFMCRVLMARHCLPLEVTVYGVVRSLEKP